MEEKCDPGDGAGIPENLGGNTCSSAIGSPSGTLHCATDCGWDVSGCQLSKTVACTRLLANTKPNGPRAITVTYNQLIGRWVPSNRSHYDEDSGACHFICKDGYYWENGQCRPKCTSDSDCNDHEECTTDVCGPDGECQYSPRTAGTSCDSGAGECDNNGKCLPCESNYEQRCEGNKLYSYDSCGRKEGFITECVDDWGGVWCSTDSSGNSVVKGWFHDRYCKDKGKSDICASKNYTTVKEICPSGCKFDACLNCAPKDKKECYQDDVWWYDSCGNRESKAEECDNDGWIGTTYCKNDDVYQDFVDRGCSAGSCFDNVTPTLIQDCGPLGCSGGTCNECTPKHHKGCYDDNLYWYDSCGTRGVLAEDCGTDGYEGDYYCVGDKLYRDYVDYGCSVDTCTKTTIPQLQEDCSPGKCIGNACDSCTPNDHQGCYNDDVYWFDSCGQVITTAKVEECGALGCFNGSCGGDGSCIDSSDCSGSTPVCDTSDNKCVECLSNSDCATGVCHPILKECVECVNNADCGGGQVCNTSNNTCVECLANSDCSDGVCDTSSNVCVECVVGSDCDDGNECTDDQCNNNTCSYTNNTRSCFRGGDSFKCQEGRCRDCSDPQDDGKLCSINGNWGRCQLGRCNRCNDGVRGPTEECDDGQVTFLGDPGDGCNNNCQVDENFTCTGNVGELSVCVPNTRTFDCSSLLSDPNAELWEQFITQTWTLAGSPLSWQWKPSGLVYSDTYTSIKCAYHCKDGYTYISASTNAGEVGCHKFYWKASNFGECEPKPKPGVCNYGEKAREVWCENEAGIKVSDSLCESYAENPKPTTIAECSIPYNIVFTTSDIFNGNLGGIVGADSKCQAAANAAGWGGCAPFKAWIGAEFQSPADRFVHSIYPYVNTRSEIVADDWNDLVDGWLNGALFCDELGSCLSGHKSWTAVRKTGSFVFGSNNCNKWTSGININYGLCGYTSFLTSSWTDPLSPVCKKSCNNKLHLYCFQQTPNP